MTLAACSLARAPTRREFPKLDYIKECKVIGKPRQSVEEIAHEKEAAAAAAAAAASAGLDAPIVVELEGSSMGLISTLQMLLLTGGVAAIAISVYVAVKRARKTDRLVY